MTTTSIPQAYAGLTPKVISSMSPLQLALANFLMQGTSPALFVNQEFLAAMNQFISAGILTPDRGDIAPNLNGVGFVSIGENVYLYRLAPDCGPDDTPRYEKILLGPRSQIAPHTFSYYGPNIFGGTAADGTNWDTTGTTGS